LQILIGNLHLGDIISIMYRLYIIIFIWLNILIINHRYWVTKINRGLSYQTKNPEHPELPTGDLGKAHYILASFRAFCALPHPYVHPTHKAGFSSVILEMVLL
jgi:hypothetical protein